MQDSPTDRSPRHSKPREPPLKHLPEPQTTKMKRANNQGPTDAFSSGAFLCKKGNPVSNAEKPLGSRVPAACTPRARWPTGTSQISPPAPDSTAAGVQSQAGLKENSPRRRRGPRRHGEGCPLFLTEVLATLPR